MWFLTRVSLEDESVVVVKEFEEFSTCWDVFKKFLEKPEDVGNGTLRICTAESSEDAIALIKEQRAEDREIARELKGTPDKVVRRWAKSYGVDMHEAATLTTSALRGGKSTAQWIEDEMRKVTETGFDPGEGKGKIVRHEIRDAASASVEFSRLVTIKSERSRINERYDLVRVEGRWLIDSISPGAV